MDAYLHFHNDIIKFKFMNKGTEVIIHKIIINDIKF